MPRSGPRTVRRYSEEFKLTAVRLSEQPGIQVKTVAAALAIHPFMLSKWRKDARDGVLRASQPAPAAPLPRKVARELAYLEELERKYAELQEEHELRKKVIRFSSARQPTASPSSTPRVRPPRAGTRSPRSVGATR